MGRGTTVVDVAGFIFIDLLEYFFGDSFGFFNG